MKNIRIGNHYSLKYLSPNNRDFKEITPKKPYVKSFLIKNKTDQPLFNGVLNILPDGRALINVNYVSYSGVKNKYVNYFDKDGNEIIHKSDIDAIEKRYWNSL